LLPETTQLATVVVCEDDEPMLTVTRAAGARRSERSIVSGGGWHR
jgi:hypothetical protein